MFVCYRMVQSWGNLAVGRRREEVGRPKLVVAKEWPRQIVITGEATAAEVPRFFQHTTAEPASWLVDLDHRGWVGLGWRRVKLRLCASLLALSSSTDWVSCNEEVANARAQYSLIQKWTQPVVPLYCHLMPLAGSFVSIAQKLYPD